MGVVGIEVDVDVDVEAGARVEGEVPFTATVTVSTLPAPLGPSIREVDSVRRSGVGGVVLLAFVAVVEAC